MLIEFNDEMSTEDKLKLLLAYHYLPLDYKVDIEDMPMVVLALNQDDIASVKVNDEGAMDVPNHVLSPTETPRAVAKPSFINDALNKKVPAGDGAVVIV